VEVKSDEYVVLFGRFQQLKVSGLCQSKGGHVSGFVS
jgi:hypothetical protein